MKKSLLLLISLISFMRMDLSAQVMDKEYMDLFDLYMMDDYEKCLKKAMKYTENDKSKKDAQPWFYVTMCYYKISMNSELEEKYPGALMESFKAAKRFRKFDVSGKVWNENQDFFDEYKAYVLKKFTPEVKNGSYKEAAKHFKKFQEVDESDYGIQIIAGITYILANKMEGVSWVESAIDSLKSKYTGAKFKAESLDKEALLQSAFVEYSAFLAQKDDQKELAMKVIEAGRDIMVDNDEVQRQYARMNRK
ncbi:MAG: hypothetical protein KDD36_13215 [Flavobacteriales bacterium]|nr:hypothetical protein [Flavobacteriales bacterium]